LAHGAVDDKNRASADAAQIAHNPANSQAGSANHRWNMQLNGTK